MVVMEEHEEVELPLLVDFIVFLGSTAFLDAGHGSRVLTQ